MDSFITQLLIAFFTAGTVYGAIRSDIKNLHEKVANNKESIDRVGHSVERSHVRIDDHITDYHRDN